MGAFMAVTVEDLSIRDLDRLHEIEKQCFTDEAFTKEQIVQLLKDYNSIGLVARSGGKVIGFVLGTMYVDRNAIHGHILTIDVSPDYRRRRIGQALLKEIESIFRQKGVKTSRLEVREDNAAAIHLYTRLGYKEKGRLGNYYGKTHGIYFEKVLT
jgi:ribosomal-protein-alanine acetyltransferase